MFAVGAYFNSAASVVSFGSLRLERRFPGTITPQHAVRLMFSITASAVVSARGIVRKSLGSLGVNKEGAYVKIISKGVVSTWDKNGYRPNPH